MTTETDADQDPRYLAMAARDARFDGRFFIGVTTTGIYCRPVCRVKLPRYASCQFFDIPAQAEAAGFRPCMRCRPELAPKNLSQIWSHTDASRVLADTAAGWISQSSPALSPAEIAKRLGVSERHLRRIFEAHLGISPLQAIQTQRLLQAKALLTDTQLPIAEIAHAAGFASLRRFNDAFVQSYRMPPSRLRKDGAAEPAQDAVAIQVKLGYRPPLDVHALLKYLKTRQISTIENIAASNENEWTESSIRIENMRNDSPKASKPLLGWVRVKFDPATACVHAQIAPTLASALPQVLLRVRAWLDLDADPQAIAASLGTAFPGLDGLRVPGCLDGFALAVRAVLGQQVTVAAGRTFMQRVVDAFGEDLPQPLPQVSRAFPSAAALARVSESALGELGIVKTRQQALIALARATDSGELKLGPSANVKDTMAHLQSLPGVGPWTANYIAMRALRWPDAFPAGDVALQKSLGLSLEQRKKPSAAARLAESLSQSWRPWRSYGVVRAWRAGIS